MRLLDRSLGMLAFVATVVHAQTTEAPAGAAGLPPQRTFSIVPSLTVSETATDNRSLVASGRQADLITQVTPSLRVTSNGGRFQGFLDYSLTGLLYARSSSGNEFQNSLHAVTKLEAIENWAYLDVNATVAPQSVSAFGTQSADSSSVNGNRTEVRTLELSPYVRGRFASTADYEARLTRTATRSTNDDGSDNNTTLAKLNVDGESGLTLMTWSTDASREIIDYLQGRRTEDDRVRGLLHFAVDPELRLTAIAGREWNDYVSSSKEGRTTSGWGLDWNPSERTHLSAQREQRFFGNSHSFSFEHRRPSSVWSYRDTRDIRTDFGRSGGSGQGTAYDQVFAQLASRYPDPQVRAVQTTNLLNQNGLPPNSPAFGGSSAAAATVERRQEISVAWLGVRDTVSFIASRSEARRVDSIAVVDDDFANGNLVRQSGLSLVLAHRLTPLSSIDLSASTNRNSGSLATQSTTLRSFSLGWSGQLGPNTRAGLSARHQKFDSPVSPYTESAVIASLSMQF